MLTLRPQQLIYEDAIRQAFKSHRSVMAVASTGFGKAVCLADMAFKAAQKGHRVLVVTNRRIVVLQLNDQCQRAGIATGIIMGSIERDRGSPVQIASIQTLERRGFSEIDKPNFLLIDECHNYFNSYRQLIRERFTDIPVLGMTATPVGPGGAKIGHFDVMVEPIKNSEIIAAGDLLKVHPYIAPYEPDLGGINLKAVSQDELGQRVEACTVYGDVFREWEPYRHMQTLAVLPNRATARGFLDECLRRNITAKVVDGTTDQSERNGTFSEFKSADCQMIIGVDVIREGLDLPIAQCLIDLQPTHQYRIFAQKLGRVKRPHPGQESAVVIDFAGNLWRHMIHPDQDPPWDEVTSDQTIEEANERKAGTRCPKCGSRDIYGPNAGLYKCEDCGEEWATRKPWVCPVCRQALSPWQKCVGGACPNCGAKVGSKPVKRIRFESGEMRTVPADEVKRRKKKNQDSEEAGWLKWVYIAKGWNGKPENAGKPKKTLNWCRAMFQKENGAWPRRGLKYLPDNAADMKRAPEAVYPWLRR